MNRSSAFHIWLSFSESLTHTARQRLTQHYGSAEKAFLSFDQHAALLIGQKAFDELKRFKQQGLDALIEILYRHGIHTISIEEPLYPSLLRNIPDPPELLFYQGTLHSDSCHSVSIVGSRRETRYGRDHAFRIARDLAQSHIQIVSGLAYGIDTAAHLGCLEGNGRTIAVLGSGLNAVYPKENGRLAHQIIESGGAILTEYPPDAQPLAYHFPIRNRLVSGLSEALLLIEAREKSGTLITVGHALEQGREVFAVPGPIDAPASVIPNRFIREGARLCASAQDLLFDMGWEEKAEQVSMECSLPPDLTSVQKRIYDAICDEDRPYDEIRSLLALSVAELNTELTLLEMNGYIELLPGKMIHRTAR